MLTHQDMEVTENPRTCTRMQPKSLPQCEAPNNSFKQNRTASEYGTVLTESQLAAAEYLQ